MAVDPHCIVERFYILKYKPVCMAVIHDAQPVGPFPLYQGMEAFYAGIIPWAGFRRIAAFHPFGRFFIVPAGILHPTVAVDDQRPCHMPPLFRLFHGFQYPLRFQRLPQCPGNDLPRIQVHDAGQVYKAIAGSYVGDILTPRRIRPFRPKIPVQYVF